MRILVTGSAGHPGEALVRVLGADRATVRNARRGVEAVLRSATLHLPHVATHSRQALFDTNVTGTW